MPWACRGCSTRRTARRSWCRLPVYTAPSRATLIDKPNHDCVFFQRGVGCTVYEDRPQQCRTWPFWRSVVADKEDWDDAARTCPGMDRGRHHAADEISASAADDGLPLASTGKFWLDRRQRSIHKLPSTRKTDTPQRRAELWQWCLDRSGLTKSAST